MKFLKKRSVAIAFMVLAILLSIGIGRVKGPTGGFAYVPEPDAALDAVLDESLDTAYYGQFVYDKADVLNSSAEQKLALYNANWDARYSSLTAFVSVDNVSGDAEAYAREMSSEFGLGDGDALLLVVKDSGLYRFVWGSDFDTIMNPKAQDQLAGCMDGGSWEGDTLAFYTTLHEILVSNFGVGMGNGNFNAYHPVEDAPASSGPAHRTSVVSAVILVVIFVLILILLLSAIDRSRYNAYRSQYYGVVNPPVVFRPIFFWHGPGSAWYRRSWRRPAPPPPPPPRPGGFGGTPPRTPGGSSRPPGGFGGTRPGGTSGSSRPGGSSSGFGGAGNRGPRGTGFDRGGSFGGTRGSSPRPGSFGGSSFGGGRSGGSFGGSRGGGFGGGRSGGSFGGSRGGGFGGGSRGGGFGGKR